MNGKRKTVLMLLGTACAALLLPLFWHVGAQAPPPFVPGRLLVKFRAGVSAQQAHSVLAAHGSYSREEIPQLGLHFVALPAQANEEAVAHAFKARPEVEFAELDRILPLAASAPVRTTATITPNDPWFPNEWYLTKISAPTAWETTTGSSGVTVAILDTGVDGTHPDLAEKLVPGWNIYNNNADTSDVVGHGTAVAGVVGAMSNNGLGVSSVAWGCRVMPIRIADASGSAAYSAAASGLTWAADHGARVANLSFIMSGSSAVTSAANYFQSKGGVVTISAGNYSTFDASPDNPAVLTVSGTTSGDVIWASSNTGNNVDLCAPYFVYTTIRGGGYSSMAGTSFSAPIVAGVAALMLSANPALTAAQVQDILRQSADDLGAAGWDSTYGAGRVNAARALSLVTGNPLPTPDTTPPIVSITAPTAGSSVSGTTTVQVTATDNVAVAAVSLSVDGALLGTDTAAPYSFAWGTTAAANSAHTLTVTATDTAGNTANQSVSVSVSNIVPDTTPPSVSIIAPAAGAIVSNTTTVQVTAADNVGVTTVSLKVDGVILGTSTSESCNFAWNTTTVANGAHTLTVTATDAAGNSASNSITVTVSNSVPDTTPPAVSITSPTGGTVSGTIAVQVSASDNLGVTAVTFSVDGVLLGTDTAAPYSFSWDTTAVANGAHTLTAIATDAAGNSASNSVVVTVNNPIPDTTPPTVSITSPSGGSVSGLVTVSVNVADNIGVAKVELYVDGILTSTATTAPFSNKWNTKKAAAGAHTLQCRAYDAAGNVGASALVTVNK